VDDGAASALRQKNRSLLAAGIIEVEGIFQQGDIVDICDSLGVRLGSGITNYAPLKFKRSRALIQKISPTARYDSGSEVVHRNNLVIL